jgi:predicted RNA-binding protein with PUA-like domain
MQWFLAKTDPDTYSIEDLAKDRQTAWDGVTHPQAVNAIRSMRPGDKILIYHSGGESAIVGTAEVISEPRSDPAQPKSAMVDLKYRGRLEPPTSLKEVKESGMFDDWLLVRNGRLSTMAAPDHFIDWLRKRYPKL